MKKETSKGDVLARWKNKKQKEIFLPAIPNAPKDAMIPLSNGQRRLWFLQDLNKENSFYNFGESYSLKGDWSIANLKKSLLHIYDNNSILRSSCFTTETFIALKVVEDIPLVIKEVDFSHLTGEEVWKAAKSVVEKDFKTPFDLAESPLFRISIVKLTANFHVLSITMHHIITDEWSMEIFNKQLSTYYSKFSKGENVSVENSSFAFSDFAYWDAERTFEEKELAFWKEKLSNLAPTIQLQTDFKRPSKPSYKGAHKTIEFSQVLSGELFTLAKESQVTPFVLLLSIFYTLLHRYTNQTDIVIGSPIANRNYKEVEKLLGFFVDTLILRNPITSNMLFTELVSNVKKNTLEAFSHKDVPFDVLVKEINPERSTAINPFFQVMFVYNAESEVIDFGNQLVFEKNNLVDLQTSKFDLTLFVSENKGRLSATFEYATDLYQATTIDRFLSHLELLAKAVVLDKNSVIGKLPMLTDTEIELFEGKPEEIEFKSDKKELTGIHQYIVGLAATNPAATALSFGQNSITYQELNIRSSKVAARIVQSTKGKNLIIGLCITRSIEMIVGLLGILKSGSAYLPLDPEYPIERTKFILKDSKAQLVLTEKGFSENFHKASIPFLDIFEIENSEIPEIIDFPKVSPDTMAYVIYTSGSTGKPKGVPISHKNIISSTEARFSFYDENPSAFLLLSSISFDSSKAGIFWTLCSGGNLVIGKKRLEQDMLLMEESIVQNKISHLLTLPTLYNLMLEHIDAKKLQSLTTVIVAGETCPIQLPKQHFKKLLNTSLYNEYGPTETTVWCIGHKLDDKNYKSIPIGKAIDGVKIYLLNKNLNHVPYGAVGEIYITGLGLAKGYLNNKELSKTKFILNPFSNNDGCAQLYKSGDLGRYNSNGNIEFLGRSDSQVKLRGFRIELDEIENTILNHSSVQESTVVISSSNEKMGNQKGNIVAFVIPRGEFDNAAMLSYLKKELPNHMVPARVIPLEDFVKLPNGKVDKKHLENFPLEVLSSTNTLVEASTETEKKLIQIWEELFGFSELSVTDNFFEIGGDSIMTIQVIAKARKMGMAISPNQLFEYQTIAALADYVDKNKAKDALWDYIVPIRKEGAKKPLFCIHAGGGHIFFYNNLTNHLKDDIPIYALQPSGLYGSAKMHTSVDEMANSYLKAIRSKQSQGPYNILVYCFSAAVGNEMAIRLKEMGEEINLIVMDTMTAPAVLNTPRRLRIRTLSFFVRLLKSPFLTIRGMIISKYSIWRMKWKSNFETEKESKELQQLRLNLMQLSQSYRWKPYEGKTSIILTKKDHESLNRETIRSWKEISQNDLQIIQTKGSHRLLFDEPYVKHTAEAIEKCMFD